MLEPLWPDPACDPSVEEADFTMVLICMPETFIRIYNSCVNKLWLQNYTSLTCRVSYCDEITYIKSLPYFHVLVITQIRRKIKNFFYFCDGRHILTPFLSGCPWGFSESMMRHIAAKWPRRDKWPKQSPSSPSLLETYQRRIADLYCNSCCSRRLTALLSRRSSSA